MEAETDESGDLTLSDEMGEAACKLYVRDIRAMGGGEKNGGCRDTRSEATQCPDNPTLPSLCNLSHYAPGSSPQQRYVGLLNQSNHY